MRPTASTRVPKTDPQNDPKRKGSLPDTQHDEPLRLLDTVGVLLRVAERRDVDGVGLADLVLGAVANKDGLAAPLDAEKNGSTSLLSKKRLISKTREARTLMMTFLPSGMLVKSTSTLANAKTSEDADMLVKKSVTVDLAPAAVTRPIEPTIK